MKYPKGTKFISYDSNVRTILDITKNKYIIGYGKTPILGHYDNNTMSQKVLNSIIEEENCEIIFPHGYQSPLWKVLNGEEID